MKVVKKKKITEGRVNGRFAKGVSGNPAGKPIGCKTRLSLAEFEASIANVEKRLRKNLLEHFIETAFTDTTVLIAVMRKRLPDLAAIQATVGIGEVKLSPEECQAIQKEIQQQYGKE